MDKQEYDARIAWLRRYRQAMFRQQLLAEDLAERRAEAERITPLLKRAVGGASVCGATTSADKLPKAVEQILAVEAELTAQLARCEAVRAEVLAVIRAEPDERLQELLWRRYILGQTLAQTAAALHIEPRWARRLHRKSIENLKIDPQEARKSPQKPY